MSSATLESFVGREFGGRYRLDALLGAGGMGAVFKAWDSEANVDVAVKILQPDVGANPGIAKRFDREIDSASRLDHPNCVRVSDFGTADGTKYLVMELLEGCELAGRVDEPWPVDGALAVLEQIFAALAHAHARGIVHRDLKPENIFLARDDSGAEVVKLVDFGIAKLLDADGAYEVLTRAGMIFGTPLYMSPEQAAGGKIDERSDLYSAGLIAHELLRGAPTFDGDSPAVILRKQVIEAPPALPDRVPPAVVELVESLLEKSRRQRPESAAAALESVRALRAQLSRASAAPTAPPAVDEVGPSLPSKPNAMIGHSVAGRFRLDALIGMGGMGAVFRALDLEGGATVAVKVLHAVLADDDEMAARFEREAETASRLDHPGIVPVLAHGTSPGIGGDAHYLVMPLLEGVELRDRMDGAVPPEQAAALARQILEALEHAHGRAVVHRDLKPENVFIVDDGHGGDRVQLVDFGLAKVTEGGSSRRALTQFGQVFGTPVYMSPEQCMGEVVDARTDLYAVGILLYEMLAGAPPFDADDPVELLTLQIRSSPPALSDALPAGLRQLVAQLLVKRREDRIPDARTAIGLLDAALTEAPVVAHTPPAGATIPSMVSPAVSVPEMSVPVSGVAVSGASASGLAMPGGAPPRRRVPAHWIAIPAVFVAILVVIAIWPAPEDDERPDDPPVASPAAGADPPKAAPVEAAFPMPKPPGASEEVLLEIDRKLTAKNGKEALALIETAREQFPEDCALLWRQGRALELLGKIPDRQRALERYVDAATCDPDLRDLTEFESELRILLRDPDLREVALDVSVRQLGESAYPTLVEFLNDSEHPLGYVDRHRALDALAHDFELLTRVDSRRQLELDLRQAADAPTPCTAFADALARVDDRGEPHFLAALSDRDLRVPDEPGGTESPEDCRDLDVERERVRGELAAAHPEAAAAVAKKHKKGKKKGKKKGFRLPF